MKQRSIIRIGRGRYIAGILFFTIFMGILSALLAGGMMSTGFRGGAMAAGVPVFGFIAWGIFLCAISVARLRDMDAPQALALLALIPYLNVILCIILCIVPGTPGTNKYGPAPEIFFSKRKAYRNMGMSYKQAAEKIFEETIIPGQQG